MEDDSIDMEDDSIDMEDDSIDMEDDSIDMGYLVTWGMPRAALPPRSPELTLRRWRSTL